MNRETSERIQYLLQQWLEERETPAEGEALSQWLGSSTVADADWEDLMEELMSAEPPMTAYDLPAWQPMINDLIRRNREGLVLPKTGRLRRLWPRWAAAALFLIIAGSTWLWYTRPRHQATITPTANVRDLPPGGNHATLTLANGKIIVLDTAKNGTLTQLGTTQIEKTSNEGIAYLPPKGSPGRGPAEGGMLKGGGAGVENNTLTTPRGGQYQLTLPDGTRVWLNAQSSITYPTAFTGKTREVTVTGECYFEVTRAAAQPFTVHVGQAAINVLGTSFNVNAYPDEQALATTLVDGKIAVSANAEKQVLNPGEQLQVAGGKMQTVAHADLQQVLAWKNGLFSFTDADLPAVMRQLSRWYDVDVQYAGAPKKRAFNGEIGRNLTLTQVLNGLAKTRVNYAITGPHTIVIKP